jgi:hypothetical protein
MQETDYGKKPYISRADTYLEYSGEITKQYVEGLGYKYDDSYKQPYLFKDYHNMMYLYDTPETQITGQAYGGKRLTFGGDAPRVDDQYFDNSPQVASLSNFNSYARENYLIMGKPFPTVKQQQSAGAGGGTANYTPTTEYIIVYPADMYGSAYWAHFNQARTLSVGSPAYGPSNYSWQFSIITPWYSPTHFTTDYYYYPVGTLNPLSGYNVTYTAISGWQGGWSDPAVYFYIELYLTKNLCQSQLFRLSA